MAADFQVDVKVNVKDYGPILRSAVNETAKAIRQRSRTDIAAAGKIAKFARGMSTTVSKVQGGFKISVDVKPAYARAFEYGSTSIGKPMLWIPVAPEAKNIKARDFPAKLFRPKGKDVLAMKGGRVIYAGVSQTTIRPRLHLRDIAEDEANKFLERLETAERNA